MEHSKSFSNLTFILPSYEFILLAHHSTFIVLHFACATVLGHPSQKNQRLPVCHHQVAQGNYEGLERMGIKEKGTGM
jgi:hypothetical protein